MGENCPRLRDKFELTINNNFAQFVVTEPRKNVCENGIVHRLSSIVHRLWSIVYCLSSTVWVLVHAHFNTCLREWKLLSL